MRHTTAGDDNGEGGWHGRHSFFGFRGLLRMGAILWEKAQGGTAPGLDHIRTAQAAELKAWSLSILDAKTLDDVFKD